MLDLTKLPSGRTFDSYFADGKNALMIQGHVESGNSFNITSIVVEPYDVPTGIDDVTVDGNEIVDVYSITGVKVRSNVARAAAADGLAPGIYIVGNKKLLVR